MTCTQGQRTSVCGAILIRLLACLLVLSGCGGTGSGVPDAVPTPATPGAAPTRPPTLGVATLLTMSAQQTPGSRYTPAPLVPPVTGQPCPSPGPPLTPVTVAPIVPPAAATGTLSAGAVPQAFPGPCVDHRYNQPLAFAPDGRALAVGGAATVALYNPAAGRALWALPTPARPTAFAFAPEGESLAVGLADGRVPLCRAADGAIARVLDRPGRVYGDGDWYIAAGPLAFSPDGLLLATGYVGFAALWTLGAAGLPTLVNASSSSVLALAFAEDGANLLVTQLGVPTDRQRAPSTSTAGAWPNGRRAIPGRSRCSASRA